VNSCDTDSCCWPRTQLAHRGVCIYIATTMAAPRGSTAWSVWVVGVRSCHCQLLLLIAGLLPSYRPRQLRPPCAPDIGVASLTDGRHCASPPAAVVDRGPGRNARLQPQDCTRSSAIAEGPRDASCQLKSCQLPRNSAETTCTTSPEPSISCR